MTQPSTTPAADTTSARLLQARADVIAEMGRTDAKASGLLTVLGIPLAVLIAAVPGHDLPVAATVLVGLGVAGLAAAMVLVLAILLPRLGGDARGSFIHWATCTPEEVTADLAVDRSVERLVALSEFAVKKMRSLRVAILTTAGALGALALALAVTLS
ncbi:Pycsar system effector family protein [Streptomyces goshikiensis]|uniref:Pycsar system effector family protein n=1 Tax=Streptomyces goshikiensis TaxID=1942 RepID=UPI0036B75C7E